MSNAKKLPTGIRLTRAGKYQIRYTGPDGQRYSGGTYRTKTDANRALAIIQASISNRSWKAKKALVDGEQLSGNHSLSEWSEEWLATRASKKTGEPLSSMTKKYYRGLIRKGLSSFDRPIVTITSGQVRRWWTSYRLESPRAANGAYKYLNALMNYAVTRDAIRENPCEIEGATTWEPKPKGRLASREVIDNFIDGSSGQWKAFFAVVVYGGLRKGEVAELRVGDVLRVESEPEIVVLEVQRSVKWLTNFTVEVGRPKSTAGIRRVALSPKASQILTEHLSGRSNNPSALIFSRDLNGERHLLESTIRNELKKSQTRFGFSESLHRLRDYSLTWYAQQGATLQEIMSRGGHTNVRAAMAYQRDAGRDADLARGMN